MGRVGAPFMYIYEDDEYYVLLSYTDLWDCILQTYRFYWNLQNLYLVTPLIAIVHITIAGCIKGS